MGNGKGAEYKTILFPFKALAIKKNVYVYTDGFRPHLFSIDLHHGNCSFK